MKVIGFEQNDTADGTSLQGYVSTTYAQLVEQFGEPTFTNGDKVTAEWCLDIKVVRDGELDEDYDIITATIYDWKEYETPMGRYRWHVGGDSYEAVDAVLGAMRVTA
jgi:hypothetical protein